MAVIKNLISLGQHEYGQLSSKNFKAYKDIPGFEKKNVLNPHVLFYTHYNWRYFILCSFSKWKVPFSKFRAYSL